MKKIENAIVKEAELTLELEQQLENAKTELIQLEPRFAQFLEMEKKVKEQSAKVWPAIKDQMIAHNIRSIKSDRISLTVVERISNWSADMDILPKRFTKKVPDSELLTKTFRLEGKVPAGAEPTFTTYLMRRIK